MMGLTGEGIDRVRVLALAAGAGSTGGVVYEPHFAMVEWRSCHGGKLHQVYVDGRLAGVTSCFGQRRMVVSISARRAAAVRVEVFAVAAGEAHVDFGAMLEAVRPRGRVEIGWLRRMGLPTACSVRVYSNGGAGEVDYAAAADGAEVWPVWQEKCGFGMGRFAESDFGYDGSAAVGFGCGLFGEGEFGFDADAMRWVSGELAEGLWRFGVKIADAAGNEGEAIETGDIVVVKKARGVGAISVEGYDKDSGELLTGIQS